MPEEIGEKSKKKVFKRFQILPSEIEGPPQRRSSKWVWIVGGIFILIIFIAILFLSLGK